MDRAGGGRRFLIVRPSALGDVCRTVPVLASIRAAEPDAVIDWVVQDGFVDAIVAHPALDDVVRFNRHRFGGLLRHPGRSLELARWLGEVRASRYDVVIDCQGLVRSAFIARFTGAPVRIGWRNAREGAWLAYSHRVGVGPELHAVDRMLALLRPLDMAPVHDMRLYVPDGAARWWGDRMDARGWQTGRYAVLAPTSRWTSKRWPLASWGALLGPMLERSLDGLVIAAAPSEADEIEPLRRVLEPMGAGDRIDVLVGESTIGRTMAAIDRAALLIANDSAPLHMGVGLDVPTVGLFGPTDPALVGPYGRPDSVLQRVSGSERTRVSYRDRGLGDELMRRIAVADVLERVDRILAAKSTSRSGIESADAALASAPVAGGQR